jgi:hypothetical protein
MLSDATNMRVGDNVHCMSHMHTMKEDFKKCVKKYQACGGNVSEDMLTDKVLDDALESAAATAQKFGRSAPGKSEARSVDKCSETFAAAPGTMELVTKYENSFIAKHNLGQCCSE